MPVVKSTMTVMKAPKMRFCKAIPAPEAIAAKMAMPWRVYSNLPANVKIRCAEVSFYRLGTLSLSHSYQVAPMILILRLL